MVNQIPQFLYLTTIGWKTGKQHRIEIWFVEYNKRYYLISEHRKHAHWVQNIVHNPRVLFTVGHETFEGTAQIVDPDNESNLADKVLKLMDTKYSWDNGLIVELIPQ
ncbi:MAG TPA: nitroreductase family deazaflavin-dependent oxidoreductase [Nitrososphaeraceae archaeon]|nr:nitroreductase family deazaflavin-dependent oxidoreductase [Nitrososphaeraceae archaeon]